MPETSPTLAPKSNRFRRVDMSQQLCRVLQGHLTLREAEAVVRGIAARLSES